ncbi:MAG: aldo/keto reductase [Thermoplasmata archaeon]
MKYRKFKGLDWKPSALGFGAMRLPFRGDDRGDIIEDEAAEMIRYAIDHGVNYIDTAWPYHDGKSEEFLARVLKDGYRGKVKIATKLPSWDVKGPDDPEEFLDKQLDKLQVDSIDFYLLHGLSEKTWKKYLELDIFNWLEEKREEGKIEHIGFSFHDSFKLFKEIVDHYDWDFCQIQYNYLDQEFQAGKKGLRYAADNGLGVIIMEPLRGGKLAKEPPEAVKEIWDESERNWNPVEWALRWLWNQEEVSLVLSGMSTLEQVKEDVRIAANSGVDDLTDDDIKVVEKVAEKFRHLSPIDCTGCNYCVPCPNGVAIPHNFDMYNHAEVHGEYEESYKRYHKMKDKSKASNCVECGQCEERCPQDLRIMELLSETAEYFEKDP